MDVKVNRKDSVFDLSVYRKPTFTGIFLNFKSNAPESYKKGLVNCLLSRSYTICSNWNNFHVEVGKLFSFLINNGYPKDFLNRILNRFLDKKFNVHVAKQEVDWNNTVMLSLPYFGYVSENIKKQLVKVFKKEGMNVIILFKTFKVSNYFRLKDITPRDLMANVVYEFKCPVDQDKSYIGMTTRHLITRVKEHGARKDSAICGHFKECTCKTDFGSDKFMVIAKGRTRFEVQIKEALLIKEHKPYLNIRSKSRNDYTLKLFN